ncbi:MAG: DSD1 family PLP-dependent enzyme, partial [Chloroflexi bacterium]|nr:DSD1 family PLP-dependent enzyme [Chloroflexota bacterium]
MIEYEPLPGAAVADIDTPALLLDLGALEGNLDKMAAFFAVGPTKLRPHFKTVKSPAIARMQLARGAIGITCAKVGEAEALVAGGIRDILIANQVVGKAKIARLMSLARQANMIVAVDNPGNIAELSAAARAAGTMLGVLVEVNVGTNRCGVAPGEPAIGLCRQVAAASGLRFDGLMGYEGFAVHIADRAERERAGQGAMKKMLDTKAMVEADGLPVKIVSGVGTGTYDISGQVAGVTEVQAGSYATMDTKYKTINPEFDYALTVLCTVISRPTPQTAITDTGMKAVTYEFGYPEVKGIPGARLVSLSEEHGKSIV